MIADKLGRVGGIIAGAVGGIGMVGFAVTGIAVQFSRCPRCGRFFFMKMLTSNIYTWRCRHCGLSLKNPFPSDTVVGRLLRLWVAHPHPRPPIPDVGLACPKCGYSLTGLVEERCPECGSAFSIASMVSEGEQT